jgi:hypothetical protein
METERFCVPELLFNPGDIGKLSCANRVLVVHHLLEL